MNKLQRSFNKDVKAIRKKIPKKYNKALLLDSITNPDHDLLVSITTRGDGKSYNYFNALIRLAIAYDEFKVLVIMRKWSLRATMAEQLEKTLEEQGFDMANVYFKVMQFHIMLYIDSKPILIITDLNAATDLKQMSALLKDYRFLVYDEFLALESSYLPDEVQKLQTIYESVDRGENKLLPNPKILLLGNPVNFSSPLLSYFNLFSMLEKQPMNTVMANGNVIMERFKNDNINDLKNKRLFTDTNGSISGEFKINRMLIPDDQFKLQCSEKITIKLHHDFYLIIHYNPLPIADPYDFYLQVSAVPTNVYDYCFDMVDQTPQSPIIDEQRQCHKFNERAYIENKIKFSDTFSINYVDTEKYIKYINIKGMIAKRKAIYKADPYHISKHKDTITEQAQHDALKKRLAREYLGG